MKWLLIHHNFNGCCYITKMDVALSQFYLWMFLHHTSETDIFTWNTWSLVLDISGTFLHHTPGWTFLLDAMVVVTGLSDDGMTMGLIALGLKVTFIRSLQSAPQRSILCDLYYYSCLPNKRTVPIKRT